MIIMPHPYGRLANRLIIATTFISQVEEYGDTFVHLAFADYCRYFEGTKRLPFLYHRSANPVAQRKSRLFDCVNIWNTNDKRGEIYDLNQEPFLAAERTTRCLFVIGWSFRTPTLVTKHNALTKKIFTPIARHRDAVARLTEAARKGTDHLIGVHIRQTDYKKFANGKYFYSPDVYCRIMQDLEGQLKGRTRFLLCSDAPLDLSLFKAVDVVQSTGHKVEDNYALAACDYIVGPPSTYTAWSSFYGNAPLCFIQSADATLSLAQFEPVLAF